MTLCGTVMEGSGIDLVTVYFSNELAIYELLMGAVYVIL